MRGPNPQKRFKNLGLGNLTVPFGGKTLEEPVHPGVDFANTMGTPIPAMTPGVVTKTEGGHQQGDNNFGNTVELRDADGNTHQFHHLQNINVQTGQQVQSGQQIATMGNTGATYSPSGQGDGTHLDYRIVSAYGKYVNPMTYVKNLQSAGSGDGSGGPGKHAEIVFVRHGTTKLNSDKKLRGWSNPPLDDTGLAEAEKLGKAMKKHGIHVIVTSDLTRAKQTADAISKHTGVPIIEVSHEFRPWNVGDLTGKGVKETLPILEEYAHKKPHESLPGGESFNDFRHRFLSKLISVYRAHGGKKVAVVAHHRNDRLIAAWEAKGMPDNFDIHMPTFLQKGIDPASARKVKKLKK